MLDVIHFFYEEDSRYTGHDQAFVVDSFRDSIYGRFYGTPYKYKVAEDNSGGSSDFSGLDASLDSEFTPEAPIKPFNPRAAEVKPFFAPTEATGNDENPFGDLLDSPIG